MLNSEHYVVLAGNPASWDEEMARRCNSGDDLCSVQIDQWARGRRSATLVQTIYGWSVRINSGLAANQILFGGRQLGRKTTKEETIEFGKRWANEDPEHREFIAYRRDVEDQPA